MGSALADHIHHDASVGEDLQITSHRVALELGILHTDHHQARLNIDFGYTVHSKPAGRSHWMISQRNMGSLMSLPSRKSTKSEPRQVAQAIAQAAELNKGV